MSVVNIKVAAVGFESTIDSKEMMKKTITIIGFAIYGTIVGFISIWFRQNTDSLFLLNIPGTLLGDVVYGLSIRFFGNPYSSQAHYTIPRLFRIPQVYVPASILLWGLIGTILALFLKPKVVAWIVGVYLAVFGSLYVLASLGIF